MPCSVTVAIANVMTSINAMWPSFLRGEDSTPAMTVAMTMRTGTVNTNERPKPEEAPVTNHRELARSKTMNLPQRT